MKQSYKDGVCIDKGGVEWKAVKLSGCYIVYSVNTAALPLLASVCNCLQTI